LSPGEAQDCRIFPTIVLTATARSKNVSIFSLVNSLKEKKSVTVQINIVHNTLSINQR